MNADITPVLQAAQTYADTVTAQFAVKDEAIASLTAQIADAGLTKSQLAEAIEQVAAVKAQLLAMQENLTAAPNDTRIAELEGKLASAETNAVNWRKAKQTAQSEANGLTKQVSAFQAQEAEYKVEVAGLRGEVAALEARLKKAGA